ncbi:hypothetical protein C4901_07560 [Acidiferrobacter sp. SPIII_3]|nr:hypothetical protein C4901_07560 [Acidiferrobacter sp. SPIII_3]
MFFGATSEEVSLYADGLVYMNRSFYGERRPFGVKRRDGVVVIEKRVYKSALLRFRIGCFSFPRVGNLERRFRTATRVFGDNDGWLGRRSYLDNNIERRALISLMSYHVMNWFIPFRAFNRYLVSLFGEQDGEHIFRSMFVSRIGSHISSCSNADDRIEHIHISNPYSKKRGVLDRVSEICEWMTECDAKDYQTLMAIMHIAMLAATEEELRRIVQLRIFSDDRGKRDVE